MGRKTPKTLGPSPSQLDARSRGFIDATEYDDADHAARKALKALNGLIRHLESTPDFGRK